MKWFLECFILLLRFQPSMFLLPVVYSSFFLCSPVWLGSNSGWLQCWGVSDSLRVRPEYRHGIPADRWCIRLCIQWRRYGETDGCWLEAGPCNRASAVCCREGITKRRGVMSTWWKQVALVFFTCTEIMLFDLLLWHWGYFS